MGFQSVIGLAESGSFYFLTALSAKDVLFSFLVNLEPFFHRYT